MRARWQWRHAVAVSGHTVTSPSLREVHERLVRLGSEPASDADAGWQDLRRKLPDRPLSWSARLMAWLRRPAIAMMTTGLLSTGVAHAAGVQPVRSGVEWLIGGVTSIVGGKSDARDEPDARGAAQPRPSDGGAGPSEENRRRLLGGAGLDHDRGANDAPAGRGRPVPGGAGSGGDEDRDERRDDGRDERAREDDDGEELEDRDDIDDEEVEEPDDEEVEEPDDEEVEEPDDEPTEADRDVDTDGRDDLEGDAYDEVDPEEDRD